VAGFLGMSVKELNKYKKKCTVNCGQRVRKEPRSAVLYTRRNLYDLTQNLKK
jgi:hypothetical protein